jgi:succinate dehydrogenase hydrophobic anchor subunit
MSRENDTVWYDYETEDGPRIWIANLLRTAVVCALAVGIYLLKS